MGYLAWAWNPATQQITITQDGVQGISFATAFDFRDIALGIAANGWVGVPWTEQCEQNHFCSEIKFILTAGTYFWDMEKQVTLASTTPAFAAGSPWFYILGNAGFRLGNQVNLANRVSERGCHILNNNTGAPIFRWQVGGFREFYSSIFNSIASSNFSTGSGGGLLWNSVLNNLQVNNSTPDMFNLVLSRGTYGLVYCGGPMDYLLVQNMTRACYARGGAGFPFAVSNTLFRNNGVLTDGLTLTTNKIFLNCDSDTWTVRWTAGPSTAVFLRQYNFDCTVFDRVTGVGIVGAIVNLYDQTGALVFSVPTGAGGAIATQTVTYEDLADGIPGDLTLTQLLP